MIAVTAAAVAVVASVALAVGLSGDSDDGDQPVAEPSSESANGDPDSRASTGAEELKSADTKVVPEPMGGQKAIDALGDDLARVAERHDMTPDELRQALLRDDDLRVTPSGTLLYADTMTPPPAD